MGDFLQTLLIACVPATISALITGFITYRIACKNAASQIDVVKEQNKHDLDKLMEQHKIDIDNLKEAHRLEMERMEQEHKNKLELLQKEFENSLLRQQKEGETVMATEAIRGIFGMVESALTTPEGQHMLGDAMKRPKNGT